MELIYGTEKLCPRVKEVQATDTYQLNILFTNGERRIFDAKPLLKLNAFKPLADLGYFKLVKVAFGSIEWPNGIDYCPDTLYMESVKV
jgi:hypothetical protein